MLTKKVLVSALIAAGAIGAAATPLSSVAEITIYATTPPPAVRVEPVPEPRTGYVWSNGHWKYEGGQYVWTPGEYVEVRPGYVYVQPRWVEISGRWGYEPPRWDRDGDGVPNRADAAPDNPRRN